MLHTVSFAHVVQFASLIPFVSKSHGASCGVPGGIDYALQVLEGEGKLSRAKYKDLCASINVWMRAPLGCISGYVILVGLVHDCLRSIAPPRHGPCARLFSSRSLQLRHPLRRGHLDAFHGPLRARCRNGNRCAQARAFAAARGVTLVVVDAAEWPRAADPVH